jgi:integrase
MSLADVAIRGRMPPGRYPDGKGTGLMLEVSPTGAKRWVMRLRIHGKRTDMRLGPYPVVGLAEARALAEDAWKAARRGEDPRKPKATPAEDAAPPPAPKTLADALAAYVQAHSPAWRSPKTARIWKASVAKHAAGLLTMPTADIGKEDVRAVLAPIWTSAPSTAQDLRTRLESLLSYAIAAGWRDGPNPAAWKDNLQPLLARPDAVHTPRHHPALPWQRVPSFLLYLRRLDAPAACCLHLAILTACRSGEARGADWSEIDLAAALWTIPGSRMKTGTAHRIPLSAPALALLRSLLHEDGRKPASGLVFRNGAGKAFSDMALLAVVKRMHEACILCDEPGWTDEVGQRVTPHGFRSSFRSWCGDHAHPRELAEASLAHAYGSQVEAAYIRTDLLDRRRQLMEAWGTWCAPAPRLLPVQATAP